MEENTNYLEYKDLKIDPVIFTQGFVPGCDMRICGGQCCNWGVYMDRDFEKVVMNYETQIKEEMDEFQPKDSSRWFEKELEPDEDFPSGYAIGTELYISSLGVTQCVFKDKRGYCSLQVTAVNNGMHKWEIKPKYCIMYPLTIVDNVLTYDSDHSDRLDYCGRSHTENFTQTVFEAMTEEIKFILGEDGYKFLLEHFNNNYKKKVQIEILK
ncbi:MAG TPA: DUF3109 family protein [Ignavibacteria bacterium]|nr:DUF3109 domain-containing protein [Bacteroidota bacterium]HRI85173.1 DUF3109 family protein [Ignavibacteria bacterium]HRK00616.1 DUF3109 family protein [Ignavibacteria bacterium]